MYWVVAGETSSSFRSMCFSRVVACGFLSPALCQCPTDVGHLAVQNLLHPGFRGLKHGSAIVLQCLIPDYRYYSHKLSSKCARSVWCQWHEIWAIPICMAHWRRSGSPVAASSGDVSFTKKKHLAGITKLLSNPIPLWHIDFYYNMCHTRIGLYLGISIF